jgi:hypothetical protein
VLSAGVDGGRILEIRLLGENLVTVFFCCKDGSSSPIKDINLG